MSKIVPLEGFGRVEKEYITIIEDSTLNFDIVAYATEEELVAAQPRENTIGVVTTTPISNWVFSFSEPIQATEGMLWILIEYRGNYEFNVLEKNGILVYPFAAKQYIDNSWQKVIIKTYQSNQWANFWDGSLYLEGNEYEAITGGWVIKPNSTTLNANTMKTDACLHYYISGSSSAAFLTALPIRLDDYTKLHFECMNGSSATDIKAGITTINQSNNFYSNSLKKYCNLVNSGTATLDISEIKGKYYLCICDYTSSGTYAADITKIWLE